MSVRRSERMSRHGRTRQFAVPDSPVVGIERQHRRRCLLKFDGYRLMCRIEGGRAKLITRGGHDWTDRMAKLAGVIQALPVDSAWLDGEVVVLTESGVPDFNALQ